MAKDIVKKEEAALPAFLNNMSDEVAGLGNSTSSQDNTLPFLAIIQKGSPQINKQEPEYIKGAEVGMLLNTATGAIFSGEEGVEVIPCGFQKAYVEWVPRAAGGGYVATHAFDANLPRQMGAQKDDRGGLILPNGNQLVETAYTFVLVSGTPLVIGASSTALKPMRDWMSLRNSFYIKGKVAPSFARVYNARTVYQKNDKGDWYSWRIEDRGWVTDGDLYARAFEFAKAVKDGSVMVGRPDDLFDGGARSGDDDIPL